MSLSAALRKSGMTEDVLSIKYAQAIFQLAVKSKITEEIKTEMESLLTLLAEEEKIALILKHPGVSKKDKIYLLEEVVGKDKFEGLFGAVLKLLIFKNKFGLMKLIYEEFKRLNGEFIRQQVLFVESSVELSSREKEELMTKFSEITGGSIKMETSVNPLLLGGLRVVLGNTVYEATLKGQLDRLRESISGQC